MKNKDILKAVKGIEDSVRESESKLSALTASLKGEEVISSLYKWKTISTAKIQRQFKMGYASASILIDNLLKRRLIVRRPNSLTFNVVKKKK